MIANSVHRQHRGQFPARELIFGSFGTDLSGPYNNIQTALIPGAAGNRGGFSAPAPTNGVEPLDVSFTDTVVGFDHLPFLGVWRRRDQHSDQPEPHLFQRGQLFRFTYRRWPRRLKYVKRFPT